MCRRLKVSVYEPNQCSQHWLPWAASLNPCTNLAEFSLKKRWRYMMRTSAWQLRFRTSTESAINRESPSAASRPRWSSLSREKSWRRWEGGTDAQSCAERVHKHRWESDRALTLSVRAENRGWYRRSRALETWRHKHVQITTASITTVARVFLVNWFHISSAKISAVESTKLQYHY